MTQALRITSKRPNFRRCGVAHPDQPVDHEAGSFTGEQIERLKADPMLIVQDLFGDEAIPARPETINELEADLRRSLADVDRLTDENKVLNDRNVELLNAIADLRGQVADLKAEVANANVTGREPDAAGDGPPASTAKPKPKSKAAKGG